MKKWLLETDCNGITNWQGILFLVTILFPVFIMFLWGMLVNWYHQYVSPTYRIDVKGTGKFYPMKKQL